MRKHVPQDQQGARTEASATMDVVPLDADPQWHGQPRCGQATAARTDGRRGASAVPYTMRGSPALVAQRIEHLTTDQKVGGSSPSERASVMSVSRARPGDRPARP